MPKYVKNGREIFASAKAYALFYAEQGYLPVEKQANASKDPEDDESMDNEDLPDDFEDEDDGVDLSPNGSTPLAARVALLSYKDLKAKAKELGIPKYSQTKQEDLAILVTEAIENAA